MLINTRRKQKLEWGGGRGHFGLHGEEGLIKEERFELKLKRLTLKSMNSGEKCVPGGGNSKSKGPVVGMSLSCLKKTSMAGL